MKKSKAIRIQEALAQLNKAISMDGPHICIALPFGIDKDDDRGKRFVKQIQLFIQAYKEYYGLKKVKIEFVL